MAVGSEPWNNLFLMVIMVWMQTGFAMVVLSAAIKAIPDEIIEAARIDGASEFQVFRQHHRPQHPADDRRRDHLHGDQRAEGVRHRLRAWANAEANGTEVIAERMIRWFFLSEQRRARRGHRGRPVRRGHPGDDLERPPLPASRRMIR